MNSQIVPLAFHHIEAAREVVYRSLHEFLAMAKNSRCGESACVGAA